MISAKEPDTMKPLLCGKKKLRNTESKSRFIEQRLKKQLHFLYLNPGQSPVTVQF